MSLFRPASLLAAATAIVLSACQTPKQFTQKQLAARQVMADQIAAEPLGNYFVGRRYFKEDYKMWGYVRNPREGWHDSKLVVFNEDKTLAPDRAANTIGSDNGYEYILRGSFSGDTVYEPAANQFYPEFVLHGADLRTVNPAPIFKSPKALNPKKRYYPDPE